MPPVAVPDAAVRALLARWFPGQLVEAMRMGTGVSTPVYRVAVAGEVSFLRLGEGPGERRDAEVRVHELARGLGIDVPEVVRCEREPPELDRSAALTAPMPGIPLTEFRGDPVPAQRQAGLDLARINAIPVMGYGWVDFVHGGDRHLVAEHDRRDEWAAEYLAAARTVIAAGTVPGALHDTLRIVIEAWAAGPDRTSSRLAHGDFDLSHIYVDAATGIYQGLIDFGEIRGADQGYDLGHLLAHDADAFDGIVAGYRELAPVDFAGVRVQAVAIATRALAIQLGRAPNPYRDLLATRLADLLVTRQPG